MSVFARALALVPLALALSCGGCRKADPTPAADPARPALRVTPVPPQTGEPVRLVGREGIYCAVRHDEPHLACIGTDVLKLRPEVPEPYDENIVASARANVPVVVRDFPIADVTPECALWEDGTVRCWGANHGGAIVPTPVDGLKPSRGFADGGQRCSLATDGEVQCWFQKLCTSAAGQKEDRGLDVSPVGGLPPAVAISVGGGLGCAIDETGQVWCWGYVDAVDACTGQTAKQITGLDDAVQIVTGNGSACALSSAGTVKCWAENHWGALGRPETEIRFSPEPLSIPDICTAVEIRGFRGALAALEDDGDVWMWGWDMTGDKNDVAPRVVPEASPAIDIVVGSSHGCALLADHNLRCFGKRIDRRPDKSVRPPFEDKAVWIAPRAYVFGTLSREVPSVE